MLPIFDIKMCKSALLSVIKEVRWNPSAVREHSQEANKSLPFPYTSRSSLLLSQGSSSTFATYTLVQPFSNIIQNNKKGLFFKF